MQTFSWGAFQRLDQPVIETAPRFPRFWAENLLQAVLMVKPIERGRCRAGICSRQNKLGSCPCGIDSDSRDVQMAIRTIPRSIHGRNCSLIAGGHDFDGCSSRENQSEPIGPTLRDLHGRGRRAGTLPTIRVNVGGLVQFVRNVWTKPSRGGCVVQPRYSRSNCFTRLLGARALHASINAVRIVLIFAALS